MAGSYAFHGNISAICRTPEAFVTGVAGASFEPETIELMRLVLEDAAAKLPRHSRTSGVKSELAELILKSAAGGERDPIR
jgi:hypothetical protein